MSEIQNNNIESVNNKTEKKEFSDSEIKNYENQKNKIKKAEINDLDDFSVQDMLSQIDNVQEIKIKEELQNQEKVAYRKDTSWKEIVRNIKSSFGIKS